jgi:hypothetical protein
MFKVTFLQRPISQRLVEKKTGYLNSHTDLGINAPEEDRIWYRLVTTRTPIPTKIFTGPGWVNVTGSLPLNTYLRYYFGAGHNTSWTFQYSNYSWDEVPDAYYLF